MKEGHVSLVCDSVRLYLTVIDSLRLLFFMSRYVENVDKKGGFDRCAFLSVDNFVDTVNYLWRKRYNLIIYADLVEIRPLFS